MSLQNAQSEFSEAILNHADIDMVTPKTNLLIYQNNMRSNLSDLLVAVYPLTVKLVGIDFFRMIAIQYTEQYPSRNSDLHAYGEYFSDYLSQSDWIDQYYYLIELTRFEWLLHQLQFIADPEVTSFDFLKNLNEYEFDSVYFRVNPTCYLLQFAAPILEMIDLCEGNRESMIDMDYTKEHYFALYRYMQNIEIQPLNEFDYVFLSAIQNGKSLTVAYAEAQKLEPHYDLTEKLVLFTKQGIITEGFLHDLNAHD